MITEELEKHIIDTIKEWQMKIGYQNEIMRLYYPDVSLIGLLDLPKDADEQELQKALQIFAENVEERLGKITFSNKGERYGIFVPKEGCAYVAEKVKDSILLRRLLDVLAVKTNHLAQVRDMFEAYAKEQGTICVEKDQTKEGLGHVFCFEKTEVDPYVYCIEEDGFGVTYHRFDRPDYEKLVSENTEVREHEQECIMCK